MYSVRPEGRGGPLRTLHRNNLRPCPLGRPEAIPVATRGPRTETDDPGPGLPLRWPLQPIPLPMPPEGLEPAAPLPAEQVDPELEQAGGVGQGVVAVPQVRRSQRPNLGVPPPRYQV